MTSTRSPLSPIERLPFIEPQLPTLVADPPNGDGWIHEIKYDGYRTQIAISSAGVRAFSRNGHVWTGKYPRIVKGAGSLSCRSAVIDGEAIVQDKRGVSDFKALRRAFTSAPRLIVMFAFDLLHLDGEDLRGRTLTERRALLRELLSGRDKQFPIHFSDEFSGSGPELFAAVDRLGLEGIVSKRANSRYRSGRSDAWLKTKCFAESTFEVIGLEKTKEGAITALLADEENGFHRYAGRAFVSLGGLERDRQTARRSESSARRKPPG
jgi:bifunctional non-homologous end joining protein LigD